MGELTFIEDGDVKPVPAEETGPKIEKAGTAKVTEGQSWMPMSCTYRRNRTQRIQPFGVSQ